MAVDERYAALGLALVLVQATAAIGAEAPSPLAGPTGRINALAFSPDGRTIGVGLGPGSDGETAGTSGVWLWDARGGRLRGTWDDGGLPVTALVFSRDGRQVVTGHWERLVQVRDTATGRVIRSLFAHQGGVGAVALSPRGRLLASGGGYARSSSLRLGPADTSIKLWDAATGRLVATLSGHVYGVRSLAFSPDGGRLASAGGDGMVRLWDPARRQPLLVLRAHAGPASAVAFSPDGRRLASAGWDRRVHVWDACSGRLLATLNGHNSLVHALAFSPDGRRLASAGGAFGLVQVRRADGRPVQADDGQEEPVRLWDSVTGRQVAALTGHRGPVAALAWSPDGHRLASGGADGALGLWDARSARQEARWRAALVRVSALAISLDGRVLAMAGPGGEIRRWDLTAGRPLAALTGPETRVGALAYGPQALAVGDRGGAVRVWGPGVRLELAAAQGPIAALAFAPGGGGLATAGWDGALRVWDPVSGALRDERWPVSTLGRLLGRTASPAQGAAYGPGGRLASTHRDGRAYLWSPNGGRRPLAGTERPGPVAFSPNGRLLAVGERDGRLVLWDAATGRRVGALAGHRGPVAALAWSPVGRRLASAGTDGTLRLWDPRTGRAVMVADAHAALLAVAYAPGGAWLATAGADGIVRFWDALGRERLALHVIDDDDWLLTAPDGRADASPAVLRYLGWPAGRTTAGLWRARLAVNRR